MNSLYPCLSYVGSITQQTTTSLRLASVLFHGTTMHTFAALSSQSWLWSIAQSSSAVAAVLLVILFFSGIGQISTVSYRLMEPFTAWTIHRGLTLAIGSCLLLHGITVLSDTYSPARLLQAVLPFTSHHIPIALSGLHAKSLGLTAAIIIFYIASLFILESIYWEESKTRLRRLILYIGNTLLILLIQTGLFEGTYASNRTGVVLLFLLGSLLILLGAAARFRSSTMQPQVYQSHDIL
jgi:hypothetical protein